LFHPSSSCAADLSLVATLANGTVEKYRTKKILLFEIIFKKKTVYRFADANKWRAIFLFFRLPIGKEKKIYY
jgi:hypothetical protein